MYVLQSQCNKTTTQKAIWEIHKYIEINKLVSNHVQVTDKKWK